MDTLMQRLRLYSFCALLFLISGGLHAFEFAADDNGIWLFLTKYPHKAKKLFSSLDLEQPGLSSVKQALDDHQPALACARLLNFYKDKQQRVQYEPDTWSPAIQKLAEDALEDQFTFQGLTDRAPRLSNGKLNWKYQGPKADREWAWMLNRHMHFVWLLTAYEHSQDPIYIQRICRDFSEWIDAYPAPENWTFSATWRALESARRILNAWIPIFLALQEDPVFDARARLLMLSSLPAHADNLSQFNSFWGGNHLLSEWTALLALTEIWPEFKNASELHRKAFDSIVSEILAQTYPDGSYRELSNHYHRVILTNIEQILTYLDSDSKKISPAFIQRVEQMWDYYLKIADSTGYGPLNNAGDLEYNYKYPIQRTQHFDRPDWAYLRTNGQEGTPPSEIASLFFPWAKHAVMRNGWLSGSDWAFFDLGPQGTAHEHEDHLNFCLRISGTPFLVDAGRYSYVAGKWNAYFTGPKSHNIVLIDGKTPIPPPRETRDPQVAEHTATITKDRDTFSGINRFASDFFCASGPSEHKRHILYLKNRYWIVIDELKAIGTHSAETYWNFHPDCRIEGTPNDHQWLIHNGTTLLNFAKASTGTYKQSAWISGQTEPEPLAWYSVRYNEKRASHLLLTSQTLTHPIFNVWLFQPVDSAKDALTISAQLNEKELILTLHQTDGSSEQQVLHLQSDGHWQWLNPDRKAFPNDESSPSH
jgi:hypothetical protein